MKTSETFKSCAKAYQYADDVLAGKIPAGIDLIQAVKRFKNDLARAEKGWIYHFDEERAERACRFIEKLPHTRGRWANRKKSFIDLEPWQCFFVCNIFGWIDTRGLRRFTEAFLFVARKNAKSTLAAAIALYMLCDGGDYSPEVFCGATTQSQAMEVFKTAKIMAEKRPSLCARFNLSVRTSQILQEGTGGKFLPVVGKPGDGASPSCWICDEYHEHKDDSQYETAMSGMGARDQPLMLIITTAGVDLSSPCYQYQQDASEMLRGTRAMNERLFILIYAIDPDDDWTDIQALRKANPNYGVSVAEEYLQSRVAVAQSSPRKVNGILTKHGNRWTSTATAWLDMVQFNNLADPSLRFEDYVNEQCIVATDLAEKYDFLANVFTFRKLIDGVYHYFLFPYFFLPSETVLKHDNDAYAGWVAEGYLNETDGAEINKQIVIEFIKEKLDHTKNLEELVFDPWRAGEYYRAFEDDFKCVEMKQTARELSPAMREVEAAILGKRLHHTGHPILTWMFSNVEVKEDQNRNIFPRRKNTSTKIDGAVASIMGIGAFADKIESYSETHGVLVL